MGICDINGEVSSLRVIAKGQENNLNLDWSVEVYVIPFGQVAPGYGTAHGFRWRWPERTNGTNGAGRERMRPVEPQGGTYPHLSNSTEKSKLRRRILGGENNQPDWLDDREV